MSEREKHFEPKKELQKELKKLFSTTEPVSPEIDRKIIEMAEKHFAVRRKTGRIIVLRWAGRAAAAAAVVFITLFAYFQFGSGTTSYEVASNQQPMTVTILDAFTLARNIETGGKIDKSWDLSGDGIIDKRDVDAVAFAAVRLHDGV